MLMQNNDMVHGQNMKNTCLNMHKYLWDVGPMIMTSNFSQMEIEKVKKHLET